MLSRQSALAQRVARSSQSHRLGRVTYATMPGGTGGIGGKAADQNQRNLLMLGGGALAALGVYYYTKSSPDARKEYEHIKEGVKQHPGSTK
ncbi:hypothetical protein BMF94_6088 [Rhodotorula taiwanensis]|uniref:Uncharacterized protein n=1 Tax=Rhodotorula taiwanensis TaxID=741276 RepID=A0A2S5B2B6_9BASI|nr:hypothetical protein BMF94_6088 [Rhodotorula taiwanensis]